jgi:hypothetical protein
MAQYWIINIPSVRLPLGKTGRAPGLFDPNQAASMTNKRETSETNFFEIVALTKRATTKNEEVRWVHVLMVACEGCTAGHNARRRSSEKDWLGRSGRRKTAPAVGHQK